jgi:hypothetical protein
MGYNRSGRRRTQKQKRHKREIARILRKQAAAQPAGAPAAAAPAKS